MSPWKTEKDKRDEQTSCERGKRMTVEEGMKTGREVKEDKVVIAS